MNFRRFAGAVVALGLVWGATEARAQFAVYGTYQGTRLSGIQCLQAETVNGSSGTTAAPPPVAYNCSNGTQGYVVSPTGTVLLAPSTGSLNFTGGFGGVYYDWKNFGPAKIGFDLRAGEEHSNKSASSAAGSANTTTNRVVLGGVRASFHTPIHVLKPYGQMSFGWSRSNVTEAIGTTNGSLSSTAPRREDNFFAYEAFAGLDVKIFPIMDFRAVELGIGNMNRMGSSTPGSTSVGIKSVGLGIVFHLPAS